MAPKRKLKRKASVLSQETEVPASVQNFQKKTIVFATPERSVPGNDQILITPATEPQGGNRGNTGFDEEATVSNSLSPIAEESNVLHEATIERAVPAKLCKQKQKRQRTKEAASEVVKEAIHAASLDENLVGSTVGDFSVTIENEIQEIIVRTTKYLAAIVDNYDDCNVLKVHEAGSVDTLTLAKTLEKHGRRAKERIFQQNHWNAKKEIMEEDGIHRKPCSFISCPHDKRPTCDGCRIFLQSGMEKNEICGDTNDKITKAGSYCDTCFKQFGVKLYFCKRCEGASHYQNLFVDYILTAPIMQAEKIRLCIMKKQLDELKNTQNVFPYQAFKNLPPLLEGNNQLILRGYPVEEGKTKILKYEVL